MSVAGRARVDRCFSVWDTMFFRRDSSNSSSTVLKVITSVRCLKKIYCCLNDTVSLHSFSVGVLGKQGGRYILLGN